MKRHLYTVMKRNGHWGICACGASFLECDSYREALEVSLTAASIMEYDRRTRAKERACEIAEAGIARSAA